MTIYVDILLLVNTYVNYFLIQSTAFFLHRRVVNIRAIIGAVLGSVFSLTILLPDQGIVITLLFKLIAAALIVLVVFGFSSISTYAKISAMFIAISSGFAGIMLAMWWFASPLNMYYKNATVYFDISFLTLSISTIIAYLALRLIRIIMDSKASFDKKVKLIINNCRATVEMDAFLDSGNTLIDMFSGKSVIICNYKKLESVLPLQYRMVFEGTNEPSLEQIAHLKGIKLLPYKTVGGDGIIPSFKADGVYIKGENNRIKPVDALIGISGETVGDGQCSAIINPKLLV